jgi:hypothetical protein
MGKLYGNDFSQTTISRFEALNLSFKNMCKLKPLLEKWLDDVSNSGTSNSSVNGALTSSHDNSTIVGLHHQEIVRTASGTCPVSVSGASVCGIGLGGVATLLGGGSGMPNHDAAMIADTLQAARRRKKRTNIDQTVRQALESFFRCAPKPSADQINEVAERLSMDRDVVQVWFCNRRQKEKRVHPGGGSGVGLTANGVVNVATNANIGSNGIAAHSQFYGHAQDRS